MGKELYQEDMFLKEFEAEVDSVKNGKYVVLNQTAFYPKSGGIDYDAGILTRLSDGKVFNVVFTGKFSGKISHEVDQEGLQTGDKVKGELNWDRRYKLMRYHTALHVLGGVFYKELGGVKVTGNDATTEQGRVDFNIENYNRTLIEEQVINANKIIDRDLSVFVYHITREEMNNDPDMMKLAMGIPKSIKNVRIVEIKNFDRMPDGGCHISSLKEIGKLAVKKIVNKGKNNRRLYFTIPDEV
ncbi:MAG: alanine--tRNA ligase-related protein [Candidatus Hodarchaeales archaeon]